MPLTSSMEDYLEAVLVLQQQNGYVRCVDVAEHLGVTKPSVSRAVKELSKKKCLIKRTNGTLSLTEQGQQIAKCIYEKHQFLSSSLLRPVFPTILQQKTLAGWNTLSAKKVLKIETQVTA